MIAELPGEDAARVIRLSLEYAPEPLFRAGTPQEAPDAILAAARQRLAGSRAVRKKILAAR